MKAAATISVTEPRLFTARALAIVNGYGVLLAAPVFAAVLGISLMKFSALTVLIPLFALVLTAYFLPFGFGNLHVTRLVQAIAPEACGQGEGMVVQLTLFPRIRTGLRAVLEDADDIGYLSFTPAALEFRGDSIQLTIPFEAIRQLRPQNMGLRVPFIQGWRIRVSAAELPGVEYVEFAERSSCVLSTSWRITRRLNARLAAVLPAANRPSSSSSSS